MKMAQDDINCMICGKTFATRDEYNNHRLYPCKVDEKEGVDNKVKVVLEQRTPEQSMYDMWNSGKMGPCPFCKKSLKNTSQFKYHMRAHHNADFPYTNPEHKHSCSECYKRFDTRDGLRKHKKISHKGVSQNLKVDELMLKGKKKETASSDAPVQMTKKQMFPFECHSCKTSFMTEQGLKDHIDRAHDVSDFDARETFEYTSVCMECLILWVGDIELRVCPLCTKPTIPNKKKVQIKKFSIKNVIP